MAENSAIEWTDATWNPIVGCTIVSPGCTNCYAMKMAHRIEAMAKGAGKWSHYNDTTRQVNGNTVWTGRVTLAPDHILSVPLGWRKPRLIFVNSMGDLFHESVPDAWIDKVFAVMALCPDHIFQVLTKRSRRMREYMNAADQPLRIIKLVDGKPMGSQAQGWLSGGRSILPNIWLGVSAEDQARADERIPDLLATPAAVRFVSAEPLLGPIKLKETLGEDWLATGKSGEPRGLDWIIAGGESGPGSRPMNVEWARSIRDQCAAAGTAFFMKQMSGVVKSKMPPIPDDLMIREFPQP